MSTVHIRRRRYPYRLRGSVWVREKRVDEVLNETIDFSRELETGETISTAEWDEASPTITGTTISGSNITFTITGVGNATLKIVTSDGRELEREFLWDGIDSYSGDYK